MEANEIQVGQRVRVTRIKDLIAEWGDKRKLIEPAGTIYEGVVSGVDINEESFTLTLDDGRRWGFHTYESTILITLLS